MRSRPGNGSWNTKFPGSLIVKRPLLILPDSFSSRTFFSCGIVRRLWDTLAGDIDVVCNFDLDLARTRYGFDVADWPAESAGIRVLQEKDIAGPTANRTGARFRRALDHWLDERFGYFSLAMRSNQFHGFMVERMRNGHPNAFLDPRRGRPFMRSVAVYQRLFRWYYGPHRFIEPGLADYLAKHTSALVTSNLQFRSVQPYLIAARRLGMPITANIASWDHPVGKGVVYPGCERYMVQNDYMKDILLHYHNIPLGRIQVTGWPQTDLYARKRHRATYEALLRSYSLDPALPCVLFTGNTENNNPHEPQFMERVVSQWHERDRRGRQTLIFRPHPKDSNWKERFKGIMNRPGVYVQAASYTDTDVLALLLQHVDCVVANAGTVLLDSLINDRPVVCVVYGEGEGERDGLAAKNITGHHYGDIMRSGAFVTAANFDDVLNGIQQCLSAPAALATQRQAITRQTVGEIDGQAGQRVVNAILDGIRRAGTGNQA